MSGVNALGQRGREGAGGLEGVWERRGSNGGRGTHGLGVEIGWVKLIK